MTTLAEFMILSGGDNRPPMLEKDLYDSWKSKMELYMQKREHGRMILESVEHGPLIWPMIEENGLPSDVNSLVNHHRVAKDLWERVQLLMQGTLLTKQKRECKLYDAFDKFAYIKVNTKFLNSLLPKWSKFVTDVKLGKVNMADSALKAKRKRSGQCFKMVERERDRSSETNCDVNCWNLLREGKDALMHWRKESWLLGNFSKIITRLLYKKGGKIGLALGTPKGIWPGRDAAVFRGVCPTKGLSRRAVRPTGFEILLAGGGRPLAVRPVFYTSPGMAPGSGALAHLVIKSGLRHASGHAAEQCSKRPQSPGVSGPSGFPPVEDVGPLKSGRATARWVNGGDGLA
ncbi:hypothetical protein Tco_1531790 [Tanacetum coccineum]